MTPRVELGRDRYRVDIWAIRRDGETVKRGRGKLRARWALFWERRRGMP